MQNNLPICCYIGTVKIFMGKLSTLLLLLTAAPCLTAMAQDGESIERNFRGELSNFLHPSVSDLSSVFVTKDLESGDLVPRTLSIGMISFNKGGTLEFNAGYYLTRNCLYGLDVTLRPFQNIRIRAGIQKLPNLMEANANLALHPFIGFSQQVSYLGGYRDLSGMNTRGRDSGISVEGSFFNRGDFSAIKLVAGLFNGVGLQFADVDDKKDFAGRFQFQPTQELILVAGALVGHYSPLHEDGTLGPPLAKQRFSAGLQYDRNRLFYRLECIYGLTDRMRSAGLSSYGGLTLNEANTIALKLDAFKRDLGDEASVTTLAGVGYVHRFGQVVSVRGQYEHQFHSDPVLTGSDILSLSVMLSFSAQL